MTVMSKMVAMMAVRNGGDALGYGDDDGNDAMAVRLMTAMMAMTLWKRTFPYLHACRYGKGSGDTAKRNKLATLGSSSTVFEFFIFLVPYSLEPPMPRCASAATR